MCITIRASTIIYLTLESPRHEAKRTYTYRKVDWVILKTGQSSFLFSIGLELISFECVFYRSHFSW